MHCIGWFERFKNHFNFHNLKVTDEACSFIQFHSSFSVDQSAADVFISKLKKLSKKVDTQRNGIFLETYDS